MSIPPFHNDLEGSQVTVPAIGSAPGSMRREFTLYGPVADSFKALACIVAPSSSGFLAPGQRPRLALERSGNRADLEGESGQRVDQAVAVELVQHALTHAFAVHQPGVLEHRQVPRHR